MQLAKEVLGGKYEFVLTTHIDRDHVHNHLIFNAVSFHRITSTTIPISGATTRSAAPATGSAKNTACPSSPQQRRKEAKGASGRRREARGNKKGRNRAAAAPRRRRCHD